MLAVVTCEIRTLELLSSEIHMLAVITGEFRMINLCKSFTLTQNILTQNICKSSGREYVFIWLLTCEIRHL